MRVLRPGGPKALALGILVVIALIWAALAFILREERDVQIGEHQRTNLAFARALAQHARRTLIDADLLAQIVGTRFQQLVVPAVPEYLRSARSNGDVVLQVAVADATGEVIESTVAGPRANIRDREHFQVHLARRPTDAPYVSRVVVGRVSGRPSIQLSRGVYDRDGGFQGVVVVSLDPHYFSDAFKDVSLGQSGSLSLTGLDGYVRARRVGDVAASPEELSVRVPPVLARGGVEDTFVHASPIDGLMRIGAYRAVPEFALYVSATSAYDDALNTYFQRRRTYIVAGLLLTLLITAGGFFVVRLLQVQKRMLEQTERARAAAEDADQVKTEFIATISHEVRTPLASILGFTELLQDSVSTDEERDYLRTIYEAGTHLTDIVNDVLDIARVESGELILDWGPVDISDLLRQSAALYGQMARAKGVDFFFEVENELPTRIRSDGTRLRQVLNNLLSNACKFTERGSVTLRARAEGERVRIVVQDTGPGIAKDLHEQIFQPYRQGDRELVRAHGGTGLGLALVKSLVTKLNGEVLLDSDRGKGARFDVLLPAASENAAPLAAEHELEALS